MTEKENNMFLIFMNEQREMNAEMRGFMRNISDKVQKIERGMYGDTENGSPGLIQRQALDEIRITKLETFRNKFIWVGAGALIAVEGAWHFIKSKLDL